MLMKKTWIVCMFVLISLPHLAAQRAQSITDVIADTATNYLSPMGGKGRQGEKVLVLHFKSPTEALNEWAIDRFTEVFKQRGLATVERQNWSASLAAEGKKVNAALDDASAASLGAQAGVATVFTGVFTPQGNNWALAIRAVSVASKKAAWSKNYLIQPGANFTQLATPASAATATAPAPAAAPVPAPAVRAPAVSAPAAPPPARSQSQSYSIGDIGPAGGLVFYDKGDNAGGWRYLEAAPANTEKTSFWCAEEFPYDPLEDARAVGEGKANTEFIMRAANERGGGFDWAAEICDALKVSGYDDWFLPSRDELHQMYGNLHRSGLGGFKSDQYWSSTSGQYRHSYSSSAGSFASSRNDGYWYYLAAWHENFSDGEQALNSWVKRDKFRVRAVRRF
jgi:hypothetical protein